MGEGDPEELARGSTARYCNSFLSDPPLVESDRRTICADFHLVVGDEMPSSFAAPALATPRRANA